MAFKPGNKFGKGRPPGSPNRIRKGWKESVQEVLELNGPELDEWVQRIAARNPLGAIQALATIAEFAHAKQSRITLTGDANEPVFFKQIEDDIPEPADTAEPTSNAADPGAGSSN